ncbi:YteA family regulatory protein [Paenibacillus shirakamiensis]|uniref:YteA family regulatory protein n=1 Tax=Paenibacillus shirakamiensis TaxID=1265935 RepID=A0ABS4JFX5_9BACL|nr:TraR/DksA C4-type zinc finger protein [Paenibacillus shirakamiensis]MBP1999871.1 YteA family regulatory protein [Paenibacillus shirakamiensis]
MSHLTKEQFKTLKHSLIEEKNELENHFENEDAGSEEESLRASTGELSSVDNHPADIGTETFERSRDMAIDENLDHQLEQVDHALELMEQGKYGKCETCGEDIPFERLEAIPYTSFCIDHTPDRNVSDRRPVEEEVMTLPPKGAGEHRQQHAGRFDDAEAWNSVEEFGNSDSPATAAKRDVKNYDSMTLDEE